MADITRRIPGGDCEGEGGERGRRGHRGHRGHVGATGPTGPAAPETVGPFPSPPITTRIFARATGSDESGDGMTEATAYRTYLRASQDIPRQILPGNFVIVDITGSSSPASPEVLPPNYVVPSFDNPFNTELAWTFPNAADYYPFTTATALEIIAKPKLATLATGSNNLTSADFAILSNSDTASTNLVAVQTNQNYGAADSLKGKLVQDGIALRGVIWHNTAGPNSILYLTIAQTQDEFIAPVFSSNPTGFPPGAPPGFPVGFGGFLQIVEQSAAFQTQKTVPNILKAGLLIAGTGSFGLRGIDVQLAPAFAGQFDVEIWGSRTVFIEGSHIDGLIVAHSTGQIVLFNEVVHDGFFLSEAPTAILSTLCQNVSLAMPNIVPTSFGAIGFVLDRCTALGPRYNPFQPGGRGPMGDLYLRSGVIMNSVADSNFGQIAGPQNFPAPFSPSPPLMPAFQVPGFGIVWRGGHGIVDHVKIFGAASDAIHFEGTGTLELKSVTGGEGGMVFTDLMNTPNGRFGVLVTDGGFIRVSDNDPVPGVPSSVAGAVLGNDIHVGDAPGLTSSWATFHLPANKQLYDIPPASPIATASGSRVFEKP